MAKPRNRKPAMGWLPDGGGLAPLGYSIGLVYAGPTRQEKCWTPERKEQARAMMRAGHSAKMRAARKRRL